MNEVDSVLELSDVRNLLIKKEAEVQDLKQLAKTLLKAYRGTLIKGGAVLASDRDTNHLIAIAEDRLGIL